MEKQYVLPNGCMLKITKDGVFRETRKFMHPDTFRKLLQPWFTSDEFVAELVEASWIIDHQRVSLEDVKALRNLWYEVNKS